MCLIALAWKAHPKHPLVLVANRDEFHARAAAPLAWWDDTPDVLAGRDLQEGGSWLGISRSGRIAAVTNVRGPEAAIRKPLSRGRLVADFLKRSESAEAFAASLEGEAAAFGGFNLLLFDGREVRYVSNLPEFQSRTVEAGVHALSNAQFDTPWPKALMAKKAMETYATAETPDEKALLGAMASPAQAEVSQLPSTGVSLDMERLLSSAFISTPSYGTRCTSLVRLDRSGEAVFFERRFDASGKVAGDTREEFELRET